MKKGMLVYKGKYGATWQYAQWIGEELELPIVPCHCVAPEKRDACDFLIIGSSVYMGRLKIRKWLQQHLEHLINKRIFLFIVCATPADKTEKLDQIARENIPAEIRNRCQIFFLSGRVSIKKLSFKHRLVLALYAMFKKDAVVRQLLRKGGNGVKKENINALVKAVKVLDPEIQHVSLDEEILC